MKPTQWLQVVRTVASALGPLCLICMTAYAKDLSTPAFSRVSPPGYDVSQAYEYDPADGYYCYTKARDPAHWPFDSKSPWNHPLGSGAVFANIQPWSDSDSSANTAIDTIPNGGASYSFLNWGIPVYQAKASDPIHRIIMEDIAANECLEGIRMPTEAQPAEGTDAHLNIIDPEKKYVYEIFQAVKGGESSWNAYACLKNELNGPGSFDHFHGTRAAGMSAIGGLLRGGELSRGIHHALAIAVSSTVLNNNIPEGTAIANPNRPAAVWPASSADGWSGDSYTGSGNIYMGSLLAIPGTVDATTLGLTSQHALRVFYALQNYGAYIVDTGDVQQTVKFYFEPTMENETPFNDPAGAAAFQEDMNKIVSHLKVITNNGPDSIGGGGTPLKPFAPKFLAPDR